MIPYKQFESYEGLVKTAYNKNPFPVFKNPSKDEVLEFDVVRFICHQNNLYIFDAMILHSDIIDVYDIPISNNPNIEMAYLGIADIKNGKMVLDKYLSYRGISLVSLLHHHPILRKYI